jgi:Binding-protein-dependent transport system inner membrane component/Bacterial extracellular solute-binding proteins, family 5 Middle
MPTPAQEDPMTFTRRDLLRIGTFGAAALARPTASWAQGKKPWETWEYATPPVRGGYFRRSATLDVGLLNPNHWPVNDWLVINMFYEKLLITDGSFRPVPWLAESWTFPDPLTCLMKLRKGVRFSDGEPLNAALGPGLANIIVAFCLLGWTGFARLVRGQVLLVRELPYVEAARAAGVGELRVMFRHVLPNTLAPVIVAASITIGLAILTESGTAFLGLGAEPPTASWGKELRVGYTCLERVPLFSLAPGLIITLTVLAFNFLGDGLRDALDPRLRGERVR